jgi:hypothetical protein
LPKETGCADLGGIAILVRQSRRLKKSNPPKGNFLEKAIMSRRMSVKILLSICFFMSKLSSAEAVKPDRFSGRSEMNGWALKDFGDFWKDWKLVTVRYREDTKELRFTYANPIAAEALAKKQKKYPDGAIFAKIGFVTENDPAFVSSVVPSGAKRYQFMVRNEKKFSSTDGWGYVLLNGEGLTFNGDPKSNSQACAACHHIVSDRGSVFSRPANFSAFVEKQKVAPLRNAQPIEKSLLHFSTVPRQEIEKRVRRMIPQKFTSFRLLKGPIQEHAFEGTVNEIGPMLAQESVKAKIPVAMIGQDAKMFAFAYVDKEDHSCTKAEEVKVVVGRSIVSNKSDSNEDVVRISSLCL